MNPTAIIVDDSLTVRMDLAAAFETAGFRPVLCASAAEARATLQRTPADVVILDVVLPDGDGVDLLAELRGNPATASTAILMLSSEADVSDRIRGMQTGADDYVGKPYDTGYVIAKARELLRIRAAAHPKPITVLLVDDSPTIRNELAAALAAAGYHPITAASGEDGLRLAGDHRPDAVITDGVLPGIDGPTLIRRLRLDGTLRGVPCLLLTAADDPDAELRALDSGADAFVRKGDTTIILAKLAAALRTEPSAALGEEASSLLGPKKLLVVGDDPGSAESLAATMRGEDYDVILARTCPEALDLLTNQPVDCILLSLPTADPSTATCQQVTAAAADQGVPVIMITGRDDPATIVDGLAAGADDVICESGGLGILNARIRSQVRRKQLDHENRRIRDELLSREIAAAQARAAQQLAEARAAMTGELERRNEELEAFSYSVSHDLRAPLQSLIGFNELLLNDRGSELDDEVRECIRITLAGAWRMADLVNDLLQLAQATSSLLTREQVDLSALARTTLDELRRRDPSHHVITLIQDEVSTYADASLIRILIDNLLGNAWKYTTKRDQPTIEFGQRPYRNRLTYFVRDNGAGFDMAHADNLFRPFMRLHTADDFPGTGIGLATARRIIDRHDGHIWAESVVGQGATFYFDLPNPQPQPDG